MLGCVITAAGLLVGTGCSTAHVTVAMPSPSTRDAAAACDAWADALPSTLVDQVVRETHPDSPLVAAYGDPPIVLRCGVARPEALEPTSQLVSVNGVDWFPEPLSNGYLFTTVGRVADVEVAVPADYAPEAGPLVELSDVVTSTLPRLID